MAEGLFPYSRLEVIAAMERRFHIRRKEVYFYPRNKRHFRKHRTMVHGRAIFHPAYIVGEDGDCYISFGITHSAKKGHRHGNHLLKRNPDPYDGDRPSYLRKQMEVQPISHYSDYPLGHFKMSRDDDMYVDTLVAKAHRQ